MKTVFPGTPSYSLSGRTKELRQLNTPGISDTWDKQIVCCELRGQSMSTSSIDHLPGPAAYSMPPVMGSKTVNKPSAPSTSIGCRIKTGSFYEDLQRVLIKFQLNTLEEYENLHLFTTCFSSSFRLLDLLPIGLLTPANID